MTNEGVTIVLRRLLPGLNGAQGLIRSSKNISGAMKLKDNLFYLVKQQVPFIEKVEYPCTAKLIRYYTSQAMDWDNATASFKYLLDAIVKNKIIPDDNPRVIVSITCEQHKVRGKENERMEVTFFPVHEKSTDDTVELPEKPVRKQKLRGAALAAARAAEGRASD